MKTRSTFLLFVLSLIGSLFVGCSFGGAGGGGSTPKTPSQIYATLGEVHQVYAASGARYANGELVTLKGAEYIFEASLVEYSTLSYELLYYIDLLDKNYNAMYQTYEGVVYNTAHKYVETALYRNSSTDTYDIVETRVYFGNFLDNSSGWYAKTATFTSDFIQEFYSSQATGFTFADDGGTSSNDGFSSDPLKEVSTVPNTFLIGTATVGEHAGRQIYIGSAVVGSRTPGNIYNLPEWKLILGGDWDNTPRWRESITEFLEKNKVKNGGRTVYYANLPDYSGTGERNNRNEHFTFSIIFPSDYEEYLNEDLWCKEDFFGITPDHYFKNWNVNLELYYYHWEWDNVDRRIEIGNILIGKGFHLTGSYVSTGVPTNYTRVEMGTYEYPRYYEVAYFDGTGNFWLDSYSK
jgi:hypothetical protein